MPRYDYYCTQCGQTFEVRLTFAEADTAEPACPDCGALETQRLIGQVIVKRGLSGNALTLDQMQAAAGFADAGQTASSGGHEHHDHEH